MDGPTVIGLAAVVAGAILLIAIGIAFSGDRGGGARPTERRDERSKRPFTLSRTFSMGRTGGPTSAPPDMAAETALVKDTIERIAEVVGLDPGIVTTQASRSTIRLDGETPTIEVDGVAYQRLDDVPAEARAILRDELRLALDAGLPEAARSRLEAFLDPARAPTEPGRPGPA